MAEIFMGGGTTLVEGSRLGMQMIGNDLNPVAWFVVKQELANVDLDKVKRLLADIEAEVKPQIMPYYYCDGPEGEKGTWMHLPIKKVMPADFDPLSIPRDERKNYRYEGPEIIYTFWAKHGPCQVTGCGHRTPIMSSPVMAVKTISIKHWEHSCGKCGVEFHVEEDAARMAPDVPLYVVPSEHPFSVLDRKKGVICPHCGHTAMVNLGKGKNPLWTMFNPRQLLVHAQLLKVIVEVGNYDWKVREYVLAAYQQFLNYNNSFCHWHMTRDMVAQLFSNNNFHPKSTCLENSVFSPTGSGNWLATSSAILKAREWCQSPWECVATEYLEKHEPALAKNMSGEKRESLSK